VEAEVGLNEYILVKEMYEWQAGGQVEVMFYLKREFGRRLKLWQKRRKGRVKGTIKL
jgi:hypothetical protein